MNIVFSEDTATHTLEKEIESLREDGRFKGILILGCDENGYEEEEINNVLLKAGLPVFGGIFPSIIYNNRKYNKGFILLAFEEDLNIVILEDISSGEQDFDRVFGDQLDSMADQKTIFAFVDGFSKQISALIDNLFTYFGLEFNYLGGGAGSLSLKQKPCVITNEGLKQDCAILAGLRKASGIGVQHGWNSIAGPFEVTQSEGNIVKELDNQPAFRLYKKYLEKHSRKEITQKNFFEIAKAYPFGINKLGAEKIVRDPISTDESGNLICVGEIERGTFVNLLHGNKESLIKAASRAMETALEDHENQPSEFIFFIDCISRVLYLEDDFKEELETVSKKTELPVIGALTIGEIANSGKDYLEFHNKTSVIACF